MCLGMALLTVCSCTKEEEDAPIDGTVTDENGPITLELTNLTATTAVFKGSVNLDLYSKYDEVGIIYSLSEDMEIEPLITNVVPITNIDKNNRFEKKMRSLLYGTKYYYSSYICMNGIYKFGEIQSFTTDDVEMQVSAPTVTSTTATFKGKVEIAEDDMESLSFGIAWSTGSDFEMKVNEETAELEEDGTFTLTVSDLKMDTEYHYATCIRQVGSQYGEIKKFVTTAVSMTASATKVTQTTVTFTGQAERNKADDSIEYGILYSTGTNLKVGASGCIRKTLTDAFDSNGKYSLKVTGLSNDTKYNYCWYARQGSNYKYGPVQQFTTSSVTINLSVTSITQTTATFTGDYEQPDGSDIEIGVLYSLSSSALKADSDAVEKIKLTSKNFRYKVSDLKYNTTYYYCTYVYQSGTYKYGSVQNFKTNNVTVEVSVGDITQTTATFSGKTEITESDAIEVGILYSTSSSLSPTSSSTTKKVLGNGSFSFKVEDLKNNTRYYYQYYIKQDGKYLYGERQNFMTSSITASLSEPVVTQTTATFSGNVNLAETSEIEFGILYSTSDRLTATASGVNKLTVTSLDNGTFSCKAEGLQHSTKYYYCYYACQDGSYTYGTASEFTTSSVTMNLSAESITQTTATFKGNVELTEDGLIEVGVLYSTGDNLTIDASGVTKKVLTPDSSGNVSGKVEGLQFNTLYNYCYYVCQDGKCTYGSIKDFRTSSIIATLSEPAVTQTTATFSGNVNLAETSEIDFGILYSTSDRLTATDSGVNRLAVTSLDNGAFSCKAEGLQHSTKYYYCYYACQDGSYTYGTASEFTTPSVTMNLSAESITQTTATFNGNVELTEDGLIEIGVLYSTGDNLNADASGVTKKVLTPDSSGNVSGKVEGLQFNTPYNYCYYVCQNGKYTYGSSKTFTTSSVAIKLSVDSMTQTTATFSGNIELTEDGLIEVGVLYSTGDNLTVDASGVIKEVLTPDSSGNVSYKLEGLQHSTKYYYCYYACQDGSYTYGTTSEFTTSSVTMNLSAESITQTTATFNGNVELTEEGLIEVGVLYSTGDNLTADASGVTKKVLTPDSSGNVSYKAEGLQFNATYNYCYYVCQNGIYTYGESISFATLDIIAQDLSINGTSNCYIVSESGTYKIKAVKGNSNESVGDVASAEVLWESFGTDVTPNVGDLITWASCSKAGHIGFEVPLDFKEGNAVIAVKDPSGTILWSWHIWLTDQPQEHIYNNDAGTMMDRNLGATSATPGDVGALGLLYQWGRKDPFLGSSSIRRSTEAKSTITWPSAVCSDSSNGTIAYATANPTTYITSFSVYECDWYYSGSSSTDNTRWTTSSSNKSIYDPCPVGWRVPDGGNSGVWSKALGSSSSYYGIYDDTNKGINFSIKFGSTSTIWYPASGGRDYFVDHFYDVGDYGYYWSASPSGYYAYSLSFDDNGLVGPSGDDGRASGRSVRCLKESE